MDKKRTMAMALGLSWLAMAGNLFSQTSREQKVLSNFLESTSSTARRTPYLEIINNTNKYRDLVFNEIKYYVNKSKPIPNFLLYIAAYIRDERYIPLLIKLIENEEYTHESCVNACPVVFALAIYSCFTNYPLPKLNDKMAPVPDLLATIERIKKIEIKSDKASYYVRGPGFNSILTRYEKLSTEEIIKKAGPENEGLYYRYLAASVLEYRIADAKYLSELYWLAITETENYVSVDYRSAVYGAIYKAEKAKYEGPGSN